MKIISIKKELEKIKKMNELPIEKQIKKQHPRKKMNVKSLHNLKPIKKGEVRNPKGRTIGAKSIRTILQELLSAKDPQGEWANPIATKLLQKAFNQNCTKSLIEIINRIEGRPPMKNINLNGENNDPEFLKKFFNLEE